MRTITVLNPKGGCGKTTIATCLASAMAWEGYTVTLADLDPQQSATDWLALRPEGYPEVYGVDGSNGQYAARKGSDMLIIDSPAATHGHELAGLIRKSDTLVVPLQPSPIDMRAGYRFLQHLFELKTIAQGKTKIGLVANRVKERTLVYKELTGFLGKYKAPFVAHLRASMNYVRASEKGLGVADLPQYLAWRDWEEWDPLVRWIKSKRSQPKS